MKRFFLIPLMTLFSCVMAWANVALITFSDPTRADVDCADKAALKSAIAALPTNGTVATIQLLDDINVDVTSADYFVFPANSKAILDLNGKTLSCIAKGTTSKRLIKNNGELTVRDSDPDGKGTIKNNATTDVASCGRFIANQKTLKLEKCKIIAESKMCIDHGNGAAANTATLIIGTEGGSNSDVLIESKSNNGKTDATGYPANGDNDAVAITLRDNTSTTIYCGTIKSATHSAIYAAEKATLNIQGGEFLSNPNIVAWLSGGSIDFVTVSGGSYSTTPEEYLDQSHRMDFNTDNNLFEIVAMQARRDVTVSNTSDIVSAINSVTLDQGVNMTLAADITLDQNIELPHGSALNIPAGKTLTISDNVVFVNEGATTNNGEIIILGTGFFSKPAKVEGNGAFTMPGYSKNEVGGVINYAISTPMQLQYLGYLALQDEYADKTWNIVLNTDLSMPTSANFESILEIQGTFDGQKHAINNLTGSGLFTFFKGNFKNLTMNNINLHGGAAICQIIKENSIFENVTLNGSNIATTSNACGFAVTAEVVTSAGKSYGMRQASDYIWFVNCVNNVTLYTQTGWFPGAFIGTMTGAFGKVGIYNCKNTADITGGLLYAGAAIGYGSNKSSARVEFINFENTGTITAAQSNPLDFCGVADLIGTNMASSQVICDKIDPETYIAVYDEAERKYVSKGLDYLRNKDAETTNWALTTTWTDDDGANYDVIPTEADIVTVDNNGGVEILSGTDAVAKEVIVNTGKNLTIQEGGSLTIGEGGLEIAAGATVTVKEGATLIVGADGISGAGDLVIEANQANGTGVVLFDPEAAVAKTRVPASVQITPNAHKKGENSLLYRYIGIPLYFEGTDVFEESNFSASDPDATIYFQEWDPQNGWHNLTQWSALVPFKGYATSNNTVNDLTYTFTGNLVGNADRTLNFNYGFNMYANSYTAPIQIETLLNGLSNNVNLTIYMFDDGVVKSVSKSAFYGFEDPEFTSIPAMQAFFILMENEGTNPTENINYAAAVFNNNYPNGGLYAPKRVETPACNRVRINVTAENGASDAVYMIEAADFTNEFDNGYDAVKYMNTGLNLFATTAHGRQTSTYSNDIEGTFIGIQGNGTYTMSFDKVAGEEYQIRDLQTDVVVTMSEANNYTFTVNGTNDARFVVESIAKIPTALDNVNDAKMFVNNNTLYISENNSNANVMIYAANGQLVLNEVAQPTISLNGLASGVYTVRVANKTLKFVK